MVTKKMGLNEIKSSSIFTYYNLFLLCSIKIDISTAKTTVILDIKFIIPCVIYTTV